MAIGRILVIDDEAFNLEIIADFLDVPEFALTPFESADQAWAHLQEVGAIYDAILLDRMMPGMNGIELLRLLKQDARLRRMPVIMQTAAASKTEVAEGVAAGAYYYLAKPYTAAELLAIVRAALAEQWSVRGLPIEAAPVAESLPLVCEFSTLEEARDIALRLAALCPNPEQAAIGLAELLLNALEHGNLGLSYADKRQLRLQNAWDEEISRRQTAAEYAGRTAQICVQRSAAELVFTITDCGAGFDWPRYMEIDPERAYDPNGRGIAMARRMSFKRLSYEGRGNVAVAVIDLQAGSASLPSPQDSPAAPRQLTVMVVDDAEVNRHVLSVFLGKQGYRCVLACSGEEAVELFGREHPDIILMDVMMPVMNGYEATRLIRAQVSERWVPVVFVSALDRDESLFDGLEAGGDDFMSKPINFVILEAKLRSLARTVELQHSLEAAHSRLREDASRLQQYRDHQERELAFAREVVERQMARPGMRDPDIHSWVFAADNMSGDIVAAARADGGGHLYALLADGAGHGLAAALSVLPVLTLFYSEVEAQCSIAGMVDRINRQLLATLPRGRFIAMAMLAVDAAAQTADIWVGGIPAVFWLGADGCLKQCIESGHLPLGIVDSDPDLLTVTSVRWVPGDCFVVCSDGLLESRCSDGAELGRERFVRILESCPAGQPLLAHIRAQLLHEGGGAAPEDDISVLIVDCPARRV